MYFVVCYGLYSDTPHVKFVYLLTHCLSFSLESSMGSLTLWKKRFVESLVLSKLGRQIEWETWCLGNCRYMGFSTKRMKTERGKTESSAF